MSNTTLEQARKLLIIIMQKGGNLIKFLQSPKKNILSIYGTYNVNINYNISYKKLIKAGKYNSVEENFANNFKIFKRKNTKEKLFLVNYKKTMSYKDILCDLERRGLRFAEVIELLALGAKYPILQQKVRIISSLHPLDPYLKSTFFNFPLLSMKSGKRILTTYSLTRKEHFLRFNSYSNICFLVAERTSTNPGYSVIKLYEQKK